MLRRPLSAADLIRHQPLMPERLPAILLAVHLLYLIILPSLAARAVSAIGCLISLTLYVGPMVSSRFAARVRSEMSTIDRRRSLLALGLFVLPLVSFVVQPTFAFLRLDARALLIVAWLGLCSLLASAEVEAAHATVTRAHRRRLPVLTQLLILWSSLFWLMVIWDVGVGRAVLLVSREDRLLTSFELWETRPLSQHLFLVWLNRESFEKGIAYTNHLHPALFFFYGCSKLVQLATGLPPYVGRNLTPFAMAAVGVLAFAALMPRLAAASTRYRARFHATIFFTLGFFLTEWHFWVYPFKWNFDTIFPLIAYLWTLAWASAYPRISPRNALHVTAAVALFAAFGWLYTPPLLLSLWCVFGRVRPGLSAMLRANRPLVQASMAAAAVGITVYAVPLLAVAARGYQNTSSSFLFRSGLDGEATYFQHVAQAVLQPFASARTWWSLLFPSFVPLVIAVACAWSAGRVTRRHIGKEGVFLVTPYFFSLALFPQAVSIHPYLYDPLLLLPVALMGSAWMLAPCVQSRLRGASILAALLIATILIMANLIGIAQGLRMLAH
jgi:hypothetical protein